MPNPKSDDIGILKSIWTKNDAGVWVIHAMKGLDLKPRAGFSKDYFKIQDGGLDLLTTSPGPIMNNLFATFGTTEFLVRQSIVPVVAWIEGDTEVRCIGTGFFISASGLLLTAAHVVRDPIDEKYAKATKRGERSFQFTDELNFGVLLPNNPAALNAPFNVSAAQRSAKFFMCPFKWIWLSGREVESPLLHVQPEFKLDLDIAVCKVMEHPLVGPFQPLNIGLHNLKVGDRAVAIGYSEMKNLQLGDPDFQPELMVSVGAVTAIYHDNITEKNNSTPGPNFEFNAKIPGKMSGSPVLVGGGILTKGVVSRSLGSQDNHASGCIIRSMMNAPLMDGMSLTDLITKGNEGIAQIKGAGL